MSKYLKPKGGNPDGVKFFSKQFSEEQLRALKLLQTFSGSQDIKKKDLSQSSKFSDTSKERIKVRLANLNKEVREMNMVLKPEEKKVDS